MRRTGDQRSAAQRKKRLSRENGLFGMLALRAWRTGQVGGLETLSHFQTYLASLIVIIIFAATISAEMGSDDFFLVPVHKFRSADSGSQTRFGGVEWLCLHH